MFLHLTKDLIGHRDLRANHFDDLAANIVMGEACSDVCSGDGQRGWGSRAAAPFRLHAEDIDPIGLFEKRQGESDVEWRARLRREDDECAAEADRLEKDDP